MADQITMSLADVHALADKLDGLDSQLSDDEKALMLAVFEVAGQAIAEQASDVEGFSLNFSAPAFGVERNHSPLSEGFRNAFTPGVGGGGALGQTIIISGDDPGEGTITVGGH
jgi:hypothetical protein